MSTEDFVLGVFGFRLRCPNNTPPMMLCYRCVEGAHEMLFYEISVKLQSAPDIAERPEDRLPGILRYVSAIVEVKGEADAWRAIKARANHLQDAAALYALVSEERRADILRLSPFTQQALRPIFPRCLALSA